MPTPNIRKHQVPTNLEAPSLAGWVLAPLLTINDFIYVANVTERAQKVVEIGVTRPILFFRADAGAGREFEYTSNGTVFTTIPAGATAPVAFAAAGGVDTVGALGPNYAPIGGTTYTQPLTYHKVNNRVYLGGIARTTGPVASDSTIAWLPVGFRPHATADSFGRRRFICAMSGSSYGTVEISGDGKIHGIGTGPGDNVALDSINFEALG